MAHRGAGGKTLTDVVKGHEVSGQAPRGFPKTHHTDYEMQGCWAHSFERINHPVFL